MGFLDHPTAMAVLFLGALWFARFLVNAVRHRRKFRNLPGPPHHPIFGHLISLGKVTTKLPKLVHPHAYPHHAAKEYDLPSVFYLDLFPVSLSMVAVIDPDVSYDIAMAGLPKHDSYSEHVGPITGPVNLLLSEGAAWKKWRSVFNPGFSLQHIINQVPVIIDITENFVKILDQHASRNEVFRMEEEATKATIDVIGKVVLDYDFKSLITENRLVQAMRNILSWVPDTQSYNIFHRKNPLRPLFQKYYKRQMDQYIGEILDERFKVRDANLPKKARKKTSIDLALEAYFKESGQDIDSSIARMDDEFRRMAIDNMLTLLFAGHDTTASTICYLYHMLTKHPEAQARLRQELDDVFGAGIGAAAQLRQNPYLINKCVYLAAVIKETLRLWTPASGVRMGRKDYFMKDPATGQMLPTEGFMVWPLIANTHRDRRTWGPDADNFRPERFLPENIEKVKKNGYRPFEQGPRNCIGQELASLEMKIILALTVREFDVKAAFDELDKVSNDGSMWTSWKIPRDGIQESFGDEMYQILMMSAKPREGMPARVSRREMTT